MGKGFWEWMFEDTEQFIDLERGIFYTASGNTRSMKGLFKNFDIPAGKTEIRDSDAVKLLERLITTGKLSKEELIAEMRNMKLLR